MFKKINLIKLGLILVVLISFGCKTDDNESTAPTVVSISPSDGSTDVAIEVQIEITFSESMDATTVQGNYNDINCSGNVQVSSDDFSSCIQFASGTASNENKTYTFTPMQNLLSNTLYKIKLSTNVKDIAGNTLGQEKNSSFTTILLSNLTNADLTGSWTQENCDDSSDPGYNKKTLVFSNNSFTETVESYADLNCVTLSNKSINSYSFILGSNISTGNEFDITFNSKNHYAYGTTVSTYNNFTGGFCGFTDWTEGVAKDITGLCGVANAGTIYYDIIKVDNPNLFFGDTATGDMSSSTTRPTSFDGKFYIKQ